ncbi:polysaccharide deacetylase family protein [Leeuwenhoekiella parthenopeia]|uniref:Polysaccharide deacetylase family protein n=1 Tax=Leeuwenhoekiella parthenopeia TaxID=2890320 RepID=A0ABS8GNQ9_9FLAO|nr:polysaccharide deacetylase family protein [Leeuwenhoekiella parthenopeia]MCC4211605.1 polysaccharide deacetylase family protein [Leeuwenhoekiella parthenopeia]
MSKLFKIDLPVKTPKWLKRLYPGYVWDQKDNPETKRLYLTFDDGPIPEVTPWVLETLKSYNAKATFFCIGENITKHPEIFEQLLKSGNSIGNHTFNHLKGWSTKEDVYLQNTTKTEALLEQAGIHNKLFRPPYGKIKRGQAKRLKKLGHQIIMYDAIAYDWDATISPEQCALNIINNAEPGSILVFHDSLKAEKNMKAALTRVLEHFSSLGYTFAPLK